MKRDLQSLTYGDDLLDRNKVFADGVFSIIKNAEKVATNKSLVLAIDSGWGTGKTELLHMMKNSISKEDYRAIYYNAWESDDWDNALIPIVANIKDVLSRQPAEVSIREKIDAKTTQVGVFLQNNWKAVGANFISQFIRATSKVNPSEIKKYGMKLQKTIT